MREKPPPCHVTKPLLSSASLFRPSPIPLPSFLSGGFTEALIWARYWERHFTHRGTVILQLALEFSGLAPLHR